MKKLLITLSLLVVGISYYSCVKDDSLLEDEFARAEDKIDSIRSEIINSFKATDTLDIELYTKSIADIESRTDKVLLKTENIYAENTKWYGKYVTKESLEKYDFYIEIIDGTGKGTAITNGYNGAYRFINKNANGSTKSLKLTYSELLSSEYRGYLYALCTKSGNITIKYYSEIKSGNNNNSGGNNATFTINPVAASPSSGVVNSTTFKFAVSTSPVPSSEMTAKVEFLAPDGKTYSFDMTKVNNGFVLQKALSQVGNYNYRYVVKKSTSIQNSNWMTLSVSGSNNNGGNGSSFTISPISANPSSGKQNTTNFKFSVTTSPVPTSTMTATIEFLAPDGKTYPFTMNKVSNGFELQKTLSQVGTYNFRYMVKSSSMNQTSGWMTVSVSGNNTGSTAAFPASCITSRNSQCVYATTSNAFYSANSATKGLEGQCTWYTYGRVIELVEQGYLPSKVKTFFEGAFWGTTGRNARNWPSKLGGSWYNTNNSTLPQNMRKKGLIAVWISGTYGHVGFVEEISSDGKKYRLSDFNRKDDLTKTDTWYNFEGSSDKLLGVYPHFLDLNTL